MRTQPKPTEHTAAELATMANPASLEALAAILEGAETRRTFGGVNAAAKIRGFIWGVMRTTDPENRHTDPHAAEALARMMAHYAATAPEGDTKAATLDTAAKMARVIAAQLSATDEAESVNFAASTLDNLFAAQE